MSASPEAHPVRPVDEIVTLLSAWLSYRLSNAELHARIVEIARAGLTAEQAEAVDELLAELAVAPPDSRGDLEMLARETLEAVALG